MTNINIIAAVSINGVIGINDQEGGKIPWGMDKYPADMKFFRTMTAQATVIMGRLTFESMGSRPLPKRRNIVISRTKINHDGVETYANMKSAIDAATNAGQSFNGKDIWIIGGSGIYSEGMRYADKIYLTMIPEIVENENAVKFPWINAIIFALDEDWISLEDSPLKVITYSKMNGKINPTDNA